MLVPQGLLGVHFHTKGKPQQVDIWDAPQPPAVGQDAQPPAPWPSSSNPPAPASPDAPPPDDNSTAIGDNIHAASAVLTLAGFPFAKWTFVQSGVLSLVVLAIVSRPASPVTGVNVTDVHATPDSTSGRRLLLVDDQLVMVQFHRQRHRSLLQSETDTTAVVSIGVAGQPMYDMVQQRLQSATSPNGDNSTLQGLIMSNQFPGVTSVTLVSMDAMVAGEPSEDIKPPKPPLPSSKSELPLIVGMTVGCSILLVILALAIAYLLVFSDWLVEPEEITICKRPDGSNWELGSGAFGKVYKALRGGTTIVAVKVMGDTHEGQRTANFLMQRQEQFEREILLLKSCRDRNIVQFLGACMQPDSLMLVTEYLEGGDLATALERDRSTPPKFSWWKESKNSSGSDQERTIQGLNKRVALDIARGLSFLHNRKIVHRDIKSNNILLGRDLTAKLADVGLAKVLHDHKMSTLNGELGTFFWTAPEVLLGRACDEKVDIYSYGVVCWELSTGSPPEGRNLRPLTSEDDCPAEVEALMRSCLSESPTERPSAVDIVHMLNKLR
ncbi:hypothetical protein WJX73_005253 [Symbiochloris irregularis]|uniref:Protein kinase domain-containing protein n=1 Tax=Symbiochloris irregularis TaxID=706552 RepID=A0AAW1NM88_9CHLO